MRPVVALYPESKGPADDVRGFCAGAWEFLSGRNIYQTLHNDYKAAIEANFSIEVGASALHVHPCQHHIYMQSRVHIGNLPPISLVLISPDMRHGRCE